MLFDIQHSSFDISSLHTYAARPRLRAQSCRQARDRNRNPPAPREMKIFTRSAPPRSKRPICARSCRVGTRPLGAGRCAQHALRRLPTMKEMLPRVPARRDPPYGWGGSPERRKSISMSGRSVVMKFTPMASISLIGSSSLSVQAPSSTPASRSRATAASETAS